MLTNIQTYLFTGQNNWIEIVKSSNYFGIITAKETNAIETDIGKLIYSPYLEFERRLFCIKIKTWNFLAQN